MKNEGSEPAFPLTQCRWFDPAVGMWSPSEDRPGMTIRDHACIELRVPASDKPWLNEIINRARRDEFAAALLSHGVYKQGAVILVADALLAELDKGK